MAWGWKRSVNLLAFLPMLVFLLAAVPAVPQSSEKDKEAKDSKAGKPEQAREKSADDGESCELRVEITAGEKGEPVDQASVYVKFMESRFLRRDKRVELNEKTNRDGVVRLPNTPRGKVLIQVIAPGWKTYGQWYTLDRAEQTIKIRLQKTPRWY